MFTSTQAVIASHSDPCEVTFLYLRSGVKTTTGGAKNGLVKFTFWNKTDMVCKSHFFMGELAV